MATKRMEAAMRAPARTALLLAGAVLIVVLALAASRPDPAPPRGDSVVLVELFTSQGCSSCPPADRLLSEIANDPELRGRIVPLAFHVDYWNRLGWSDPFSSSEFSARQRAYGNTFNLPSVYTPQIVIQGEREMVGSRERQVREALDNALTQVREIDLEIVRRNGSVEIRWNDRRNERDPLDLYLAVYENGLVTDVGRGENRGRKLRNDGVVRELRRVSRLDLTESPTGATTASLRTSPEWNANHLGVAAFLQDPDTLKIPVSCVTTLAAGTDES